MKKVINEDVKKDFLGLFGKHIKELRIEKNLTQSEFANRCNSNVRKVGRTERGKCDFKFSSLIVLAKGLDVSIGELIDFEYPENLFDTFWINKEY